MTIAGKALTIGLASLALAGPAQADDDRWNGYERDDRREWNDDRRDRSKAYNQGYRDGLRAEDRRNRQARGPVAYQPYWNGSRWSDGTGSYGYRPYDSGYRFDDRRPVY
ncbi:MAG: hypothetical protein ACRC1J_01770, partial [Sandaracinobacteroides sp.]